MKNTVNNNENVLRHIMAIHFDNLSNTVKPTAFQIDKLKIGLSVSIEGKLDQPTRQLIISQLQQGGGTYRFDFIANCGNIISILYNGNNAFNVFESPQQDNKSHADIKLHNNITGEGRSSWHRQLIFENQQKSFFLNFRRFEFVK